MRRIFSEKPNDPAWILAVEEASTQDLVETNAIAGHVVENGQVAGKFGCC
jgi:hypothetical protein